MADIELVINISEDSYKATCKGSMLPSDVENVVQGIKNGIPLPKGHGRLIDADALKMDKRVCGDRYLSKTSLFVANKVIEQAPTIIEADKEQKDGETD